MAKSNYSLCLFSLMISCLVFIGHSQGGVVDPLSCLQKLLPCQPYLKTQTPPPPPSCCVPLKQVISQEGQCLCAVFSNPDLLKSLNVTLMDGINLAKSCGAATDVSLCKMGAAPTPAASQKPPLPAPSTPSHGPGVVSSPPPSPSPPAASPSHSPPNGASSSMISHVATGSLFVATVISLLI